MVDWIKHRATTDLAARNRRNWNRYQPVEVPPEKHLAFWLYPREIEELMGPPERWASAGMQKFI